ncbi:MAG: type II toxin-antitoxin system VapC family toxin [Actinomycetota bacterium]|nr:type II toxin-antitoxin system VapC family toxin [Actinomycetota bacterium]
MAAATTSAPGTLFIDSSALLRRYVADPQRPLVVDAMTAAEAWAVSAIARSEVQLALVQAATSARTRDRFWSMVREDWDAFWQVPVDGRCLARATEIGAQFGLSLVDAIHLASADRLPRPLSYLTFERQQIPAAAELGMQVLSPWD